VRRKSLAGFADKVADTIKDSVAVFLAQHSLDEKTTAGDRLAAMLYLSEFSEGTRYAQMAPEIDPIFGPQLTRKNAMVEYQAA